MLLLAFYTCNLITIKFVFRIEPTQLAFIILGASMAALALMILVVAILATGATRHEVYRWGPFLNILPPKHTCAKREEILEVPTPS